MYMTVGIEMSGGDVAFAKISNTSYIEQWMVFGISLIVTTCMPL